MGDMLIHDYFQMNLNVWNRTSIITGNTVSINSNSDINICKFSLLRSAWFGLCQTSKVLTWKRYHLWTNNHSKISSENSLSWFDGLGFGYPCQHWAQGMFPAQRFLNWLYQKHVAMRGQVWMIHFIFSRLTGL